MNIPNIEANSHIYNNFSFFTKGGMGEIYKGTESDTNRPIILKLIFIEDESYEELLQREVDVSVSFKDNNVVNSKAAGKIDLDGNSYFYIIQDFYEKGNLRNHLTNDTPIETCLAEIFDILHGMKNIHSKVVHRDLKPENILIDEDGHLRISDFGLAKYIDEKTRTRSFKGAGTIPYMAPECWTGDTNSIAMDIYALGIIFYEIIAGKLPFNCSSELEWREAHLFSQLPDITSVRSDCSIKINQIIQKMTQKRISDRYKTIDEIISAFEEAEKLQKATSDTADRLAMLGNLSLQKANKEKLEKQKKLDEEENFKKLIDYHVDELYSKIRRIVDNINLRFEESKIQIKESSSYSYSSPKSFQISFLSKKLNISFCNYKAIDENENFIKNKTMERLKRQYPFGIVPFYNETSTFFKKNNIILVGIIKTDYKSKDGLGNLVEIGFNLALVKKPNDLYGEWHKIRFLANHQEPSCALNLNSLLQEYERNSMNSFYTTDYSLLNDKDLEYMLEKILI